MTTLLALEILAFITDPYQYKNIELYWRDVFADTPMPEVINAQQYRALSPNYCTIDHTEAAIKLKNAACEYLARKIDQKK